MSLSSYWNLLIADISILSNLSFKTLLKSHLKAIWNYWSFSQKNLKSRSLGQKSPFVINQSINQIIDTSFYFSYLETAFILFCFSYFVNCIISEEKNKLDFEMYNNTSTVFQHFLHALFGQSNGFKTQYEGPICKQCHPELVCKYLHALVKRDCWNKRWTPEAKWG